MDKGVCTMDTILWPSYSFVFYVISVNFSIYTFIYHSRQWFQHSQMNA